MHRMALRNQPVPFLKTVAVPMVSFGAARGLDRNQLHAIEKCRHCVQYWCLTVVPEMQKVANPLDQDTFHIAEILLEPRNFVVRHDCAEPRFTSQEQDRTLDLRQDLFVVVPFGEALEIV